MDLARVMDLPRIDTFRDALRKLPIPMTEFIGSTGRPVRKLCARNTYLAGARDGVVAYFGWVGTGSVFNINSKYVFD